MSQCISSYGKPKIKHKTKAKAYNHMNAVQPFSLQQYNVYRCWHCKYWHVGRKSVKHKKQEYDEILVGKLIGVLKLMINKERSDA